MAIDINSAYLLWRISEPEEVLWKRVGLTTLAQAEGKQISHPRKRQEWLATRLALQQLLCKLGYKASQLYKDQYGKPYVVDRTVHISLAHCASFALAAVDKQHPIGIDIQPPHHKLQSVQAKFLTDTEIKEGANDLDKLCIYWCAKEAVYKAYGGKDLSLKQDIRIKNFTKRDQGIVWGAVGAKLLRIAYTCYDRHVIAWCRDTR